jgi:ribosomal protein L11 methyltransferase
VNDRVRTWPSLDICPVHELLQALLTDYDVVAIDERSDDNWRVFFGADAERDRAAVALRVEFPDLNIEAIDVADEDWAARSQASLRAVRVGHIVVAPPWDLPDDDSDGHPLTIVIQPSMGFGTGHHATTRLCLAALQRLDLRGRSVIDVGTGSGVLAIAANLLGTERVLGIDDDEDAIASARENLDLNEQAHVTFAVADLRSTDLEPADVVVANLTGGLVEATAPQLLRLASSGGRLILSGLMTSEEQSVRYAFSPWRVEHREEEEEWVCLTLSAT